MARVFVRELGGLSRFRPRIYALSRSVSTVVSICESRLHVVPSLLVSMADISLKMQECLKKQD